MYPLLLPSQSHIIENANNQKLMTEYEKYQELQARSQKLQEVRYMNEKSTWQFVHLC